MKPHIGLTELRRLRLRPPLSFPKLPPKNAPRRTAATISDTEMLDFVSDHFVWLRGSAFCISVCPTTARRNRGRRRSLAAPIFDIAVAFKKKQETELTGCTSSSTEKRADFSGGSLLHPVNPVHPVKLFCLKSLSSAPRWPSLDAGEQHDITNLVAAREGEAFAIRREIETVDVFRRKVRELL